MVEVGGYRDGEQWPEIQDALIDAMIRLAKRLGRRLGGSVSSIGTTGNPCWRVALELRPKGMVSWNDHASESGS